MLVTGRDGVSGQRHLARRHVSGLVGVGGGSRRLRVAARDGAVIIVNGTVAVGLAGRRRSAIGDGRQAGAAVEGRSRRFGIGGTAVLPRGERGLV